jgi:hypothetical protein
MSIGLVFICGVLLSTIRHFIYLLPSASNAANAEEHSNRAASDLFRPFIPSVHAPVSELLLLWIALASAVLWHEFGHFIAAALFHHRVKSVGYKRALDVV